MSLSYERWTALIERRHRLIIAISVLVCIASALSLTRLRLDVDVLGMLPQGRPAFDDFKSFVADFGELNELVVLIRGAPLEDMERFTDQFTRRLATLDTMAAVHGRLDMSAILDGIFGQYLYNYIPEQEYPAVRERLTPEGMRRQVALDRAILSAPFDLSGSRVVSQDPLGFRQLAARAFAEAYGKDAPAVRGGYFAAADGSALLVLARPKASPFDIDFSQRLMRQVRQAEAESRAALGAQPVALVRVEYTGSYIYALEDAGTLRWDIGRYTALALIGVLAVFYVGYRNFRILPFVTYPLVVTTLVTFALSLALFDDLNAVSISFAAILYGLSIDSGIYFYTRLLQERRVHDLHAAVVATLAGLARANLAASSTTAMAFFVIGGSCISAVRQLGILTAVGMLLTTVQFFTLYPALAFVASRRAQDVAVRETPRLGGCARVAARHALPIAVLAAVAAAALLLPARRVALDVGLMHLQPRNSEAARVEHEIQDRFAQSEPPGAVLVRREQLEQALEDGEAVADTLARYQTQGIVQSMQTVRALLPSARAQRARLELYNALPRAEAVERVRATLQEEGFAPARFAGFLVDFARPRHDIVGIDNPALAPLAFLINHHVRQRGATYTVATYFTPAAGVSLENVAQRLRRDVPAIAMTVTGRVLLENALARVLHRELLFFFGVGLLGNFVLLLLSFGSAATAVAILAPVVLVVIALFAGMAMVGIALDPINLIVTPLIFGIGVDYGVYIVARAREAGVAGAIASAGRAVVVTALTTITGFGFLGLSHFPPLGTMGVLAASALFLCLVLSIILLPALLALMASRVGAASGTQDALNGSEILRPKVRS